MNKLPDKIIDIMAEEIQKEIDAEILFQIYKAGGWYPVEKCHNLTFNKPALTAVQDWLIEGCIGQWHIKSHTDYIFERQEDALMFALKWS
jgi:hypothetical protein